MKTPGVEVKPIYSIDGEHHLNEVYFSDVRVPVSNLVGEENMGWTYAKFLLMNERVGIAGTGRLRSGLGNLRAVHDYLAETAADSYDTEDLGRKHAELSVRLEALEALESRALTAEEGSGESMILPLPLKLLGTHLQQDLSDLGNEILAYSALPRTGYGFGENDASNEPPIRAGGPHNMSMMLSGRASTIYGGTSEVQRGIMSKFVLGL
jgi:alkylation response protein AidB-like acyl-CoA dehydrogenase